MSRVRLLFAPENVGMADRIAAALADGGYEVGAEGGPAAAAVVLWSPFANAMPAVLQAARTALARRVLVPVAIGKAPPPPSFEHLWPIDLSGWDGGSDDPRWRFVLDEIDLAVRRGVEIGDVGPALKLSPMTEGSDLEPRNDLPAVQEPHSDVEGVFAESSTYHASARPRPRIPFAALLAGFALFGVASGGAFLAGRQSSKTADGASVAPQPAAATAGRPIIAFVQPKDQPADTSEGTSPPSDEAASGAGSGEIDVETAFSEPTVAPSAGGALREGRPAAASDIPVLNEAETAALKDSSPPTEPDTFLAPQSTAPEELDESAGSDPIAELAWNATGESAEDSIAPAAPKAQTQSVPLGRYFRDCLECPDMAEVEPGALAPDVDADAPPVMLRRRIAVAVKETTFDEWAVCVADGACRPVADNGWGGGKRPVINVSWSDAQSYASWLSGKTGLPYRLPSETEWEFAARGGSPAAFSFGPSISPDQANFLADGGRGTGAGKTLPAASFAPNAFGIYDMHGNVAEWTADCWSGETQGVLLSAGGGLCSARVIKGGAWNDSGADLRASHREGDAESARRNDLGFRVARDL